MDYTITVENTGNVALYNVVVTDPLAVTEGNSSGQVGDVIAVLLPGASVDRTFTYTVKADDLESADGDLDNTATASGSTNPDPTAPKDVTADGSD